MLHGRLNFEGFTSDGKGGNLYVERCQDAATNALNRS
jgi:hypothetical protein